MAALTPARVALPSAVVATIVAISLVAGAHHASVKDPNDTRGRLDIRRVIVSGKTKSPYFKVVTYAPWSIGEMYEKGFVLIYLDTDGSKRFDYYAVVSSNGRKLVAHLWQDRTHKKDRRIARLHRWRSDRRDVTVKIPFSKVKWGKNRNSYRWYAQTLFSGTHCHRVCFDLAPNDDPVSEPRPGASVAPSPSPSP